MKNSFYGFPAAIILILLATLQLGFVAGNFVFAEEKKKKKKEPPPKPLQISVWGAFHRPGDGSSLSEKKLKERKLSDTRPLARNRVVCVRKGMWIPVWVELKNTTKESKISGSIEASTAGGKALDMPSATRPFSTRYTRSFEVGPLTTKLFRFSVLFPDNNLTSENLVYEQLRVRIIAGVHSGDRFIELECLNTLGSDLIAVVSDSPGAFRWLGTIDRRKQNISSLNLEEGDFGVVSGNSNQGRRRVANLPPEEMPDRGRDLEVADLIIIDGPPKKPLTDFQLKALYEYCLGGGQVLITAGKDPTRLQAGPERDWSLEKLANIKIVGIGKATRLDLQYPFNSGKNVNWSLPILEAVIAEKSGSGMSVFRDGNQGMIQQTIRELGSGQVVFLPFPLSSKSLMHWSGRKELPIDLLNKKVPPLVPPAKYTHIDDYGFEEDEEGSSPAAGQTAVLRDKLDHFFAQDTPIATPQSGKVISFFFFYLLAVVPLNYLIFGKWKRREIAWLSVPVWALVFSVAAWWIGFYGQLGQLTVNEISFVEATSGGKLGSARTFVGLYTPHRGEYSFEFDSNLNVFPGHLTARLKVRGLSHLPKMHIDQDDDLLRIKNMYSSTRSTRRMEFLHIADLSEGVKIKLLQPNPKTGGQWEIQLTNETGKSLVNPTLIYRGRDNLQACRLDNLGEYKRKSKTTGSTITFYPGNPNRGEWETIDKAFFFNPVAFRGFPAGYVDERYPVINSFIRSKLNRWDEALFVAWIGEGMLPIKINEEDPSQYLGMTLLMIPVPLEFEGMGNIKMNVPVKSVEFVPAPELLMVEEESWIKISEKENLGFHPTRDKCILRIEPSHNTLALKDAKLTLRFTLSTMPFLISGNKTKQQLKIETEKRRQNDSRIRFENLRIQAIKSYRADGEPSWGPIEFNKVQDASVNWIESTIPLHELEEDKKGKLYIRMNTQSRSNQQPAKIERLFICKFQAKVSGISTRE